MSPDGCFQGNAFYETAIKQLAMGPHPKACPGLLTQVIVSESGSLMLGMKTKRQRSLETILENGHHVIRCMFLFLELPSLCLVLRISFHQCHHDALLHLYGCSFC